MCQAFAIKINDEPSQEIRSVADLRKLYDQYPGGPIFNNSINDADGCCLCGHDLKPILGHIISRYIGFLASIKIQGL